MLLVFTILFVFYLSHSSVVQLQENLNCHLQKMFVSTMMKKKKKREKSKKNKCEEINSS